MWSNFDLRYDLIFFFYLVNPRLPLCSIVEREGMLMMNPTFIFKYIFDLNYSISGYCSVFNHWMIALCCIILKLMLNDWHPKETYMYRPQFYSPNMMRIAPKGAHTISISCTRSVISCKASQFHR